MHESLGEILRKAREASDVSIADVASRAKIPRPVIEALEAEDFGYFTSPLYARSFLKQYGEYIGADVELWLADFVPAVMIDSDSVETILGGSDTATEHSAPAETDKNMTSFWGPMLIFLITLAVIFAGVKIYETLDSEHNKNQQHVIPEVSEDEHWREPAPAPPREVPPATEPTDPNIPQRALIVEPTEPTEP